MPTSNFERLLGVVSLVAAIGAGYSAITINHFDAQMASLRASIENATARFEGQASRIDAAFTGIGDIKANTAETKVAVDYLKGDVAEMKAKVTNIQEDMQRVKGKLHADADPLPFPALVEYKGKLIGAGTGSVAVDVNKATKQISWNVTYSGLSGPAAAHIHCGVATGANSGVAVNFGTNLASPIQGSGTLTDAQLADLVAGKCYVNIRSATNNGTELRAQLMQ